MLRSNYTLPKSAFPLYKTDMCLSPDHSSLREGAATPNTMLYVVANSYYSFDS